MFAYCLNTPVVSIDSLGKRTYFINGINNEESTGAPDYAIAFSEELENNGVDDVRTIPVYNSQSGFWGTLKGVSQVALEMFNIDVYSDMITDVILNDLEENPLSDGEQLNLIGYSGGGQLALNVMEKLDGKVDNVVLIGTPVMKSTRTKTNISLIYAGFDPLSWNIGRGFTSHFGGWIGHTGYFDTTHIRKTASLVSKILK